MKLEIGQEVECIFPLYYAGKDQWGRTGQGIVQKEEWLTVTEIREFDSEREYHLVSKRDDVWMLESGLDKYFINIEKIKKQKQAKQWAETTTNIDALRKLALKLDVDTILEQYEAENELSKLR